MAIVVTNIGVNSNGGGGAATLAITVPVGGVPSGATIVFGAAQAVVSSLAGTDGVVDTKSNSYTKINSAQLNNAAGYAALYYAWNVTALVSGDTITWTREGTSSRLIAISACYVTGLQTGSSPLDSGASNTAFGSGSGNHAVTSNAPVLTDELFIYLVATTANSGTFTQDGSFTTPFNAAVTGSSSASPRVNGGNFVNTGSSSAVTATPSFSVSTTWAALIAAFKPPSGANTSQSVSATSTQSPSLLRSVGKRAVVTSAATITILRAAGKIITATQAQTANVRKALGKIVTAVTQGNTATVINSVRVRVVVTGLAQGITISTQKAFGKSISATQAQTARLLRTPNKIIAAVTGQTVVLRRAMSTAVVVLQGMTASLRNSVGKRVVADPLVQSVTVAAVKTFTKIVAATVAQTVSTVRIRLRVRTVAATTGQTVVVRRAVSRQVTVGLPQLIALISTKQRTASVAVTQGQLVSTSRQFAKVIATSLAQVIASTRRRIRAATGETEPALVRAGRNLFLITIQGHDGLVVQTLRFQSGDLRRTKPTDTPARTYYEPRVIDPGNLERHLFSSGTTRGQSSIGSGDVVLASGDSGRSGDTLDYLLSWAFDGYRIVIQSLTSARQMVVNAATLFTGTIEQIVTDDAYRKISFKIHDRLADLDKPLLQSSFGGTTTAGGMGTADGNADLAGQKIQSCYGVNFNVTPQVSNAFDLVFRFSDGAVNSIAAYDGGLALTNDGDVANLTLLLAWTQVPGHYKTCLAIGSIRVGATPAFVLTADVVEGANAAARTAAQIAKRMLLALPDIGTGDLDAATFTALDGLNDAECGRVVTGDETCFAVATEVLNSIGGYLVPDRTGVFQVGRFESPSGDPAVEITEDIIIGDSLQRFATGDDGRGIPTWKFTLSYGRNNTRQDSSGLAGAVTSDRRTFLANEWRTSVASDGSVQTEHLKAADVTISTCLAYVADADAEAARLLALHKVPRDAYRVDLPLEYGDAADLGFVVSLTSPRFGLSSGKLFTVIGRVDDFERKVVQLDIWGGV